MGDVAATWERVAALVSADEAVSLVRFSADRWRAAADLANGEGVVMLHASGRSEGEALEALADKIVALRHRSEEKTGALVAR